MKVNRLWLGPDPSLCPRTYLAIGNSRIDRLQFMEGSGNRRDES